MDELIKPATEDVKVWQVMRGKVTEMLLLGDVFAVRDDAPENLDPTVVARQFLKVFDIGRTKILRKAYSDPKNNSSVKASGKDTAFCAKRKYLRKMKEEYMSVVNNVGIYKEPITGFYRRFPGKFEKEDFDDYLTEMFPKVTKITILNKRRAYLQYMFSEGIVHRTEVSPGSPKMGFTYEFIHAPYGEVPAAKAEFDSTYAKESMLTELAAMRQGV